MWVENDRAISQHAANITVSLVLPFFKQTHPKLLQHVFDSVESGFGTLLVLITSRTAYPNPPNDGISGDDRLATGKDDQAVHELNPMHLAGFAVDDTANGSGREAETRGRPRLIDSDFNTPFEGGGITAKVK